MGQATTTGLKATEDGQNGLAAHVRAVHEARRRLEHDVDVMEQELRATVGLTMEKTVWKAVTIGAGVLAGVLMRKGLQAAWRSTRHADPPSDPYQPAGWGEALSWAAASGVGVGVARLVAARGAAAGWSKAMGAPPPGISAPV